LKNLKNKIKEARSKSSDSEDSHEDDHDHGRRLDHPNPNYDYQMQYILSELRPRVSSLKALSDDYNEEMAALAYETYILVNNYI